MSNAALAVGFESKSGVGHRQSSVVDQQRTRGVRHRERTDDPARPHLVREHGAGLLPGRRRVRGGRRRPDRAQPPARRRRARHRADLVDRVRAPRRHAAAAAAALRLVARARSTRSSSSRSCRSTRIRTVAVTPESATSVVLTKVLLPDADARAARRGGRREAADRRRGAQVRVRGSDAAPRPRPPLARAHRPADGVRRLGRARAAASRTCSSSRRRSSRRCAPRAPSPEPLALRGRGALRLPGRLPRPLLREAPLPLRPARARRPLHVPRARARGRRARRGARAPLRHRGAPADGARERRRPRSSTRRSPASGSTTPRRVALLESRDLVAVGRVANELRARRTDPDRITFIVDRNVNYTNICVTDCDFCAFYRSPGDRREGYLLPKPVIYKKIEETLALGGTGLLMQGGHHPDLGIDYYEDLFRSIKARYPIHLHALSPPEIQHISRRSKLVDPGHAHAPARRRPRLDPGRRRRDPRRPRARRSSRRRRRRRPSG